MKVTTCSMAEELHQPLPAALQEQVQCPEHHGELPTARPRSLPWGAAQFQAEGAMALQVPLANLKRSA